MHYIHYITTYIIENRHSSFVPSIVGALFAVNAKTNKQTYIHTYMHPVRSTFRNMLSVKNGYVLNTLLYVCVHIYTEYIIYNTCIQLSWHCWLD